MLEAIAAAAGVPPAEVRRAAMYSKNLGAVARAALLEGAESLARFQLELFVPAVPMLAQTAADVAAALRALGGVTAVEREVDRAPIPGHKVSDEGRRYSPSLNEVTGA